MKKNVVFIHIPKTAGSTFLSILDKQYGKTNYKTDALNIKDSINHFLNLDNYEKEKIKCISGHLTNLLIDSLDENPVTITFLRNPVDQFISSYNYIKSAKHNKYHDIVKNMKHIDEYVDFRRGLNYDNQQTRYLSDKLEHIISNTNPKRNVNESDYTRAKKNIDEIDYVFVVERFHEALITLHEKLNWSIKPTYKKKNVSIKHSSKEHFNSKTINLIKEMNKFDLLLYEEAQKKHARIVDEISMIDDKKRSFERQNTLLQLFNL